MARQLGESGPSGIGSDRSGRASWLPSTQLNSMDFTGFTWDRRHVGANRRVVGANWRVVGVDRDVDERAEPVAKLAAGAVQAAPDRPDRDPQHRADLLVTQPVVLLQHDHGAMVRGQGVERLLDLL